MSVPRTVWWSAARPLPGMSGVQLRVSTGLRRWPGEADLTWRTRGQIVGPDGHVRAEGPLHDLILAVWPGLAPVVALDGADPHGVPPAAVRAVLHWVQAARRDPAAQMRCQIAVAALWRVPPTVAASLIADVEAAALHAPEAVVPLVAAIGLKGLAMRPRWQAQAEAARRALDDVWAVEREASPAAVRSVSEEAR